MSEQLDARIAEVKHHLEANQELKKQLPKAKEAFAGQRQRLLVIEQGLAAAEKEIQALESFSLQSLIESFRGRKAEMLAIRQEEQDAYGKEYDECAEALEPLQARVEEIEQQLTETTDVEKEYQSLCEQKEQQLVAGEGEQSERLQRVLEFREHAKKERRVFDKAIETGEHLVERLHNLTNTLGRARTKMVGGRRPGIIKAIARQGTNVSTDRVREGMEAFRNQLRELDLCGHSELDEELQRLVAELDVRAAELGSGRVGGRTCNMEATMPVMEDIQATIGLLRVKTDHIDEKLNAIEDERRSIIAAA